MTIARIRSMHGIKLDELAAALDIDKEELRQLDEAKEVPPHALLTIKLAVVEIINQRGPQELPYRALRMTITRPYIHAGDASKRVCRVNVEHPHEDYPRLQEIVACRRVNLKNEAGQWRFGYEPNVERIEELKAAWLERYPDLLISDNSRR